MKYVIFFSIPLVLSLCSCQSYHAFMASQSMGPEQASHVEALANMQDDKKGFEHPKKQVYICDYYPMELGGFSTTCKRGEME